MDVGFVILLVFAIVLGCIVLIMISLLCLRFMHGVLDWGEKQKDLPFLNKDAYQRLDICAEALHKKDKLPEPVISVHTVQPYGKLDREEDSDLPYSDNTDDEDVEEYCNPIQRIINPQESLGKLQFSMTHIPNSKLIVKLLKAEELPEAKNEEPTVYVTAGLLGCPDKKYPELKSKVHRGSRTPIFNDYLEFDISEMEVDDKCLRFVIWYVDNYSQGECLGSVEQTLNMFQHDDTQKYMNETLICKDIHRITQDFQVCNEQSLQGAILCSVTYIPTTNRLTVVLFKAQNLNLVSDDNQGVYAEVTIVHVKRNRRKRKITSSVSGSNCPVYNEAILFDLGELEIENIKLQITMKQKRIDKPDKAIGRLLMGNDVYDSKSRLHWSDALNSNKPIAQWHNLHRCISFSNRGRRRLRSRLSDSGNDEGDFQQMLSYSSSSDE